MNARTILFIHQAFPGQFKLLARTLADEGYKLFALAMNPTEATPGVRLIRYAPVRKHLDENAPPVLREMDARLIRGESVYSAMKALKKQGLEPDVIYAHPGWGEGLFVRNVWPKARYVIYAEWYYNLEGQEVNFDPGMPRLTEEKELRLTLKNTCFMHALADCDAAIAPTEWQKSRFPAWAQDRITVIHDGLDIKELAAVKPRGLGIPSQGLKLRRGMPIVTYAARHLEPVRGFHYFMRALPAILDGNKEAHVIVMGHDAGIANVGYGSMNPKGTSWRKTMEAELGDRVDWKRVHFLGMLDRKLYLAMLKLSACHVYLTTPFILSWSFLEAAALGLPIVASDTAPVREFDHLKGLDFVDFSDVDGIARKVLDHIGNVSDNFFDANAEALAALDKDSTLPAICDILLQGSSASDMGGSLEDVVFEEEPQPAPAKKTTKSSTKRTAKK
ncbi:MAG: glycosyltransferase [Desulfovibrio sp.]|nr:glycosyltransferase [Desulfovibrio sp.]